MKLVHIPLREQWVILILFLEVAKDGELMEISRISTLLPYSNGFCVFSDLWYFTGIKHEEGGDRILLITPALYNGSESLAYDRPSARYAVFHVLSTVIMPVYADEQIKKNLGEITQLASGYN